MKKIFFILTIVLLSSCDRTPVPSKNTGFDYPNTLGFGRLELQTYEIDGCEYLGKLDGNKNDVLTHKGNCKNPFHQRH